MYNVHCTFGVCVQWDHMAASAGKGHMWVCGTVHCVCSTVNSVRAALVCVYIYQMYIVHLVSVCSGFTWPCQQEESHMWVCGTVHYLCSTVNSGRAALVCVYIYQYKLLQAPIYL